MIRSVLSNWFALVVNGLVSIALTPILIHGLGDFHYGMWILVASLVEYSSFIDMGLTDDTAAVRGTPSSCAPKQRSERYLRDSTGTRLVRLPHPLRGKRHICSDPARLFWPKGRGRQFVR